MYAPLLRKHKHLLKTSSSFQAHSINRPWHFAKALTSLYFARPALVSFPVVCILGCLLCFAYLLFLHISCALGSISCFSASVIAYSWITRCCLLFACLFATLFSSLFVTFFSSVLYCPRIVCRLCLMVARLGLLAHKSALVDKHLLLHI